MDELCPSNRVLNYIKTTFDQILAEINKRPYGHPQISLHRITSLDVSVDDNTLELRRQVRTRHVTYCWPGTTQEEAWRFACVGRILMEIHSAITSGITVTKRDIYYRDPALFKTQNTIDRLVDDIAYTCGVARKDLNVTASPRGLYIGVEEASHVVKTISSNTTISSLTATHVEWVLVVEKEATFNTLVEHRFHQNSVTGPGIILTARGYPDFATRHLLRALKDRLNRDTPFYGLFDADPDGLDIFRCYVVGSRVLFQEIGLSLPEMVWLGVKLNDIELDNAVPFTARDRAKARAMLNKQEWFESHLVHLGCRNMLQNMLVLNVKAEIQALKNDSQGLFTWLEHKMNNRSSR